MGSDERPRWQLEAKYGARVFEVRNFRRTPCNIDLGSTLIFEPKEFIQMLDGLTTTAKEPAHQAATTHIQQCGLRLFHQRVGKNIG